LVILIWTLLGALLGWLTNAALRTGGRRDRILSILIGAAGAVVGGLLIGGAIHTWQMGLDDVSVGGTLAVMSSAAVVLLIARLARISG
jgi:uncharacterized membrane protein YeaQ/YmgE (transglycosylase-associated protein family)